MDALKLNEKAHEILVALAINILILPKQFPTIPFPPNLC